MNAVHAIVDMAFISAMPVRILHMYLPLTFGLVYGIFNAIYDMAGGRGSEGESYVYKVMTIYIYIFMTCIYRSFPF